MCAFAEFTLKTLQDLFLRCFNMCLRKRIELSSIAQYVYIYKICQALFCSFKILYTGHCYILLCQFLNLRPFVIMEKVKNFALFKMFLTNS